MTTLAEFCTDTKAQLIASSSCQSYYIYGHELTPNLNPLVVTVEAYDFYVHLRMRSLQIELSPAQTDVGWKQVQTPPSFVNAPQEAEQALMLGLESFNQHVIFLATAPRFYILDNFGSNKLCSDIESPVTGEVDAATFSPLVPIEIVHCFGTSLRGLVVCQIEPAIARPCRFGEAIVEVCMISVSEYDSGISNSVVHAL